MNAPLTTREDVDAWVHAVAQTLPDGLRDVWLDFPAGVALQTEVSARLAMLDNVHRGGHVEPWAKLLGR